jgi:hypothetical protein
VLGCALFDRIDAGFNSLPILGYAGYAAIIDRSYRKTASAAAIGYCAVSTLGFLSGALTSYPYVHDLWVTGSLKALVALNYGALFIAVVILLIPGTFYQRIRLSEKVLSRMAIIGAFALTLWLIFAFFIRPDLFKSFPARAARELAWYVSEVAYPLFLGGIFFSINDRRWNYWLPLLLIAAATVFVYTFQPHVTPGLIYATRRWVSYAIPLIILFSAYCLWRFCRMNLESVSKAIAICGSAGVIAYYVYNSYCVASPYLSTSMLAQYPQQYRALAKSLKDTDWVKAGVDTYRKYGAFFTNDHNIASILTYEYNLPTIMIHDLPIQSRTGDVLEKLPTVGSIKPFQRLLDVRRICGKYLERGAGRLPESLYSRCIDANIGSISFPPNLYRWHTASVTEGLFRTQVGRVDEKQNTVTSYGKRGYLLYGPYITLAPGRYVVWWQGKFLHLPEKGKYAVFDISADRAKTILEKKTLVATPEDNRFPSSLSEKLTFKLSTETHKLEFRVYVETGTKIAIKTVSLRKLH